MNDDCTVLSMKEGDDDKVQLVDWGEKELKRKKENKKEYEHLIEPILTTHLHLKDISGTTQSSGPESPKSIE